jgi:hypothetical protein
MSEAIYIIYVITLDKSAMMTTALKAVESLYLGTNIQQ